MDETRGARDFVDLGDGLSVAAPGLVLEARVVPQRPDTEESVGGVSDPLLAAAAATGLTAAHAVAFTTAVAPGDTPRTDESVAAAEAPEPAADLVVTVAAPEPGTAQVLRYQDAAGLWRWRLPEPRTAAAPDAPTRFLVPIATLDTAAAPPPDTPAAQESIIGGLVRKVVHELIVYVYPVVDRVFDRLIDTFAQQRELDARPYRVRTFARDTYTAPATPETTVDTPERWAELAAGRVLLLVHGTFSTSHGGFGGLDPDTVDALNRAYGGRVIAFDHPTVSVSLEANVNALYELTKATVPLEVDILAHSRGGLVARELIRRQTGPDAKYRVRRVVFAATPNRGTPLADPTHVVRFIDRYTNLLTLLPGPAGVVGDTLAGLMTAVQVLGHAALADLDGLNVMCPGATPLRALLPGAVDTEYYAVYADFEPDADLAAKLRLGDLLMDAVFPEANDLVVPTHGVCLRDLGADAVAPGFPIPEQRALHFPADRRVWHSSLFGEPETRAKLVEWLRP